MSLALQVSIDTILRDHGVKGVAIVLGVGALIGIGKAVRAAAQMVKSRIEASDRALADVVHDARSERDAAKTAFMQALKDQTLSFQHSSAERDRVMREGFNEVLREIRDTNHGTTTGRGR
jgi:hypothetical protein